MSPAAPEAQFVTTDRLAAGIWNRDMVFLEFSRAGGSKVYYRLYLMRGDRFRDAIEIHAADDASAMEQAEQRKDVSPAELWCRGRRVATLLGSSAA